MADVWRIPWHVIPQPPATLQGAVTWWIQCHDPRATCHIAGCCHQQIQQHVILESRVTLQGAATWWIHCHNSRATLQGAVTMRNQCHDRATSQGVIIPSAILKIVFCHILFFVFFKNADWALMSGSFRIVSDTLVFQWSQKHQFVNCKYKLVFCATLSENDVVWW